MNSHIADEWIEACESGGRYDFLRKHLLDDRVMRLFGVACCREIWDQLIDERSRKAVEIAELYADGLTSKDELEKAHDEALSAWHVDNTYHSPVGVAAAAVYTAYVPAAYATAASAAAIAYKQQGIILAQMYPVDFNDNWITSTTKTLAQQIYDKKDFSLMPILADALQDVDCNEEILGHLRGPGPFYKGNYIIDKLIGKRS